MLSKMHDARLVRRALGGDKRAGERLVQEHYDRVYRLLLNLAGDPDAAQDLTQQTFVRAWQALPGFRGGSLLSTWLHRVAYREYTHWLRARPANPPVPLTDLPLNGVVTSPWLGEALDLRQALQRLSPDQREAFLLHHVQGFSIAQVATITEAPAGTIKFRLFAARGRLRELLRPAVDPAPKTLPSCESQSGGLP